MAQVGEAVFGRLWPRALYWQGLKRRSGWLPWPGNWPDRLAGWAAGGIFRLDWPMMAGACGPETQGPSRPPLAGIALASPDLTGRLWLYSFDAVDQALEAWREEGLRHVYGAGLPIAWANDAPGHEGCDGHVGPSPMRGFTALWMGDQVALFHPRFLGPLGRFDINTGTLRPGRGLSLQVGQCGVYVRGRAVPDGMWQNNRVEPVRGEGGWFHLEGGPVNVTIEEETE